MRRLKTTAFVAAVLIASAAAGVALAQKPADHVAIQASEMKWGAAPPSLPPGAEAVVLDGDPTKAAPFTVRLKFPDGYKVPPHWHPTDERVVVLSGTLSLGVGEKGDTSKMHSLTAGAFAKMPKDVRHYVAAKGATVIQVYGTGPFEVNYVNPNDDPRKKKTE